MQFLFLVPLWLTGAGGYSPGRGSFALCCGGSEEVVRSKSMERTVVSPASSRCCLCQRCLLFLLCQKCLQSQQSPPVTTLAGAPVQCLCTELCVGAQGMPTLVLKLQQIAGTLLPAHPALSSLVLLHLSSSAFISQPLVYSFVYQTKTSFSHAGFHPEGAYVL